MIDVSTKGRRVTIDKTEISDNLADLRHLSTWIPKVFENKLGISLIRYEVLCNLLIEQEMNQNDIQKKLDIDRAAITRHLQILEDKGYVQRKRNPQDSRGFVVSLTPLGKDRVTGCNQEHEALIESVFESVLPSEMKTMSHVLKKVKNNVENILRKQEKI